MSIHEGHRQRLRERFIEHGLDSFDELNSLELLLCYAIARKDTNELAHRLLDTFGSLSGVMEASMQELMTVDGIGENSASLICLIPQLAKKIGISKMGDMRIIASAEEAGNYFLPRLQSERDEVLLLLCLDNKRGIICCKEMNRGVVNSVDISVRRIAETALKTKAASCIIGHNHPSGIARPSREDDILTANLLKALNLLDIRLEDHIIVAGDNYISMQSMGVMRR